MTKQKLSVRYIILILFAGLMVFPLLFTVSLSLSENADIMNGVYWPEVLHFENYIEDVYKRQSQYCVQR